MQISLKGKKALVGGSSAGIGKAIGRQLAESGASVTLMARSENKLRKLIENLPTGNGQQHDYLLVDFSDFDKYRVIISGYFQKNSVDILVNNTQGPEAGGALEKNVEDYQNAFDLLFKNVVFTTELALKGMLKKKWGRVINVASVSVKEPLSYLALSNTIRAAVVTWGKSLAMDVGASGITVNSILTGYFDTERISQLNSKNAEKLGVPEKELLKALEESTAVKRIGDPKEFGYLVAFLASEKAGYITGTSLPIDGGYLRSL